MYDSRPLPLSRELGYVWLMARRMNAALCLGDAAEAEECAEALIMMARTAEHPAARAAADRASPKGVEPVLSRWVAAVGRADSTAMCDAVEAIAEWVQTFDGETQQAGLLDRLTGIATADDLPPAVRTTAAQALKRYYMRLRDPECDPDDVA